jgi:pimeloyl-ACP methyl ester carboxylesterase
MRRAMIGALLIAGAACSQRPSIVPVSAPARTGDLTLQPIVFSTDDSIVQRRIRAELGILSVPENRRSPTGRRVVIRFVRFPSTSANPGPPVIYLAGGPGGSGIRSAAGDRFALFMKMREAGDVIALDQRGVAEPLDCPGTFDYPLDRALTEAIAADTLRPYIARCVEHWRGRADLSAYNTIESADDLDSLREALGAETISLWGISYGTHLGLAYIRRHPDRVHRAVLAGVEGPDHTYKLPADVDAALVRAAQSLMPALRNTITRLQASPAVVPLPEQRATIVLGAADLLGIIYGSIGEREDIEQLPRRLAPVLAGDYSAVALRSLRLRRGRSLSVMPTAMDCASGATAARFERIAAQARTALVGDGPNIALRARCASWPANDLGDDYRSPIRSGVPVLFVSGALDSRTPPSNAEEVRKGFPHARHMVIPNAGHDDDLLLSSPSLGREYVAFLRDSQR